MRILHLCNAGLAITHEGQTLLIDLPNSDSAPFYQLPEETWDRILHREPPFSEVCGMVFTHCHEDHFCEEKVAEFMSRYGDIPCFWPDRFPEKGTLVCGPFVISYERMDHAPMEGWIPPMVVLWIRAGEKSVYVSSDAKLDCDAHRRFLKGRMAHAAFWTSMYLSRPETRRLMHDAALRNYIYHMPAVQPEGYGIWKKCRSNLSRYEAELSTVTVMDQYPFEIEC